MDIRLFEVQKFHTYILLVLADSGKLSFNDDDLGHRTNDSSSYYLIPN